MLTLNIIEHELHACGRVVRLRDDNPKFSDYRLFVDGMPLVDDDVLYLCATRDDVGNVTEQGHCALYVSETDPFPDDRAVFSILEGSSVLVVFNALLDVAHRYSNWERAMDSIRIEGGDPQDLMDVSSSFLQNNVVIVDPALKLLAYTKDIPCDDPITVELITHGFHTEENIGKFKLNKRFKPWSDEDGFIVNDTHKICKYVTVVRSFKTKSSFSMIIVMMCNIVDPSDYLFDVYDMFASRVEFYAKRDYPGDKPSGNAVDTFLKDLFEGAIGDEQTIKERGKTLGIPFEARFCLFYVRDMDESVPRLRLLSDVTQLVAPAKTAIVGDAVVVLCFNCRSESCALHCASNTCPLGHTSLSARLDGMVGRYGLVCGRSSKFNKLSFASMAFQQAKVASDVGWQRKAGRERLGVFDDWSQIVSFDSCVVDYMVDATTRMGGELAGWTYAGFVLDAMYRQDLAAKTDNYLFLYEYLMCERRASVVAEKLHMHRNNVKYRIDRIESQYGIDTNDPELRFDFLLAFRVRQAMFVQSAQ